MGLIWTVINSMETIWITPEVLGLLINNLCYQTRIVYPVSKASSQGFILGILRKLFPKILYPRLPWDNFTTFKNLFFKKKEKNTWSLQSTGFHSNFILLKTVKNFVLQATACGWYKKNAVWALEWIAKCPEVCASSAENPGAILTFLPGTGYFFSNRFSPYCSPWVLW